MSTAGKFPPEITNRWSKQERKRWRLVISWLVFEHELLEHELGRKPTSAEHLERVHKVIDAIWDADEQRRAAQERWKAEQAAKVVPLRSNPNPA
jgi:hypothetical protein